MLTRTFKPVDSTVGGIAANYYPHVYAGYIRSPAAQLTAFAQQSHGIASSRSGELEVMMHRRTEFFCCGLDNPLNDTAVLTDQLRITVSTPEASDAFQSITAAAMNTYGLPLRLV